jgi:hypothetical protein
VVAGPDFANAASQTLPMSSDFDRSIWGRAEAGCCAKVGGGRLSLEYTDRLGPRSYQCVVPLIVTPLPALIPLLGELVR